MYIARECSARLLELTTHFPCLILTGARQTGKTTLLKKLFPSHSFVSLDLPSLAELADRNSADFFSKFPAPVILDEVQYAPGIFRMLKILIDQNRKAKGHFILTGSQKFTLMKEVSESLAGRCAILELDTFSSSEFYSVAKPSSVQWQEFIVRGGFPELVVNPKLPAADFYGSYLATYLERDVRNLAQVGNLRDFERFIRLCAVRSGQLLNISELARDAGVSPPTGKQWISILQASNQIDLLEPYFSNHSKRMIKTPKLYFRDTGLLCFLLGITTVKELTSSPLVGNIWETFVYGQISRELRRNSSAASLWFWRDASGTEVDFVINQGNIFTLFEAKWSERPTSADAADMRSILKDLSKRGKHKGFLVSRTPHRHPIDDSIEVINGFDTTHFLNL